MNDVTLADLVTQIQGGDQAAFGQLYDQLSPLVQALCLRILRDTTDAEEVLAETFWQVWDRADQYNPARGSVEAWVTILARSRALDRLRQRQRQDQAVPHDPLAERDHLVPESEVLQDERSRAVVEAMSALSDEQRRSIELAYYNGLSQTEIASYLDQPLGTIKSRIRLALIRLRTALETHLGEAP